MTKREGIAQNDKQARQYAISSSSVQSVRTKGEKEKSVSWVIDGDHTKIHLLRYKAEGDFFVRQSVRSCAPVAVP